MTAKQANSRGFTLIELLVVIAIIGLLSTIVLASLGTARSKGVTASNQIAEQQVKNALALYAADNNGNYPLTTDKLVLGKYISAINSNIIYSPLDSDNNPCSTEPCFDYMLSISSDGSGSGSSCGVPTNPICWSDESSLLVWSTVSETTGANNYNNGRSNQNIVKNNFEISNYPAFSYCEQLTQGGVPAGTWYLPSLYELVSGYSTGLFANNYYWSSTEMKSFPDAVETLRTDPSMPGGTTPSLKNESNLPVRCLR